MATFKMTMDTCEAKPKMEICFEAIPEDRVLRAFDFAKRSFRQTEVINEETGEVMATHYESPSWFQPSCNYGEAVDIITHICYDAEW